MGRLKSPQYPSYSLPQAISNAHIIYRQVADSAFLRPEFAIYMGYQSGNGAADKSIGTMRQFGLLVIPAPRHLVLSRAAILYFEDVSWSNSTSTPLEMYHIPELFEQIRAHFGANYVVLDELYPFLEKLGFSDRAIKPIYHSFNETMLFIKK